MVTDYTNPAWIVQEFNNMCTSEGQRYLEAKDLDNEKEMHDALVKFGIGLGVVSEWTIKYLLYRYDSYNNTDDSTFVNLWERLCKSSLRHQLKQIGFSCNKNYGTDHIAQQNIRDCISNIPKHQAQIPYWQNCCSYYVELRRLISNFVVNDKTDTLMSLITGSSEWETLFEAANRFSKTGDYKYILITDRPKCNNMLDLFRIPWSVILDFDFDSSEMGGLFHAYKHQQAESYSEQYDIGNKVKKCSLALHWVTISKYNIDNTKPHDRKLANNVNSKFKNFINSYHEHNPEPAIVVIAMNDAAYERTLNEVLRTISAAYYDESNEFESNARFLLITNSSIPVSPEFHDDGILSTFNINLNQLIQGAKEEIAIKPIYDGTYTIPAKPEDGNGCVEIEKELYFNLRQYCEPVYIGIENEESDDDLLKPEDYYRGSTGITWKMLASQNVEMKPSIFDECKKRLEEISKKPGSSRIKFYYKRGMGGTTCLKKLAFEMHTKYPVIIVHSYTSESTADEIEKLYNLCKMTILIFVDSNYLYYEEMEKLYKELKSKTFGFVMIHLLSTTGHHQNNTVFPILTKFTPDDYDNLIDRLKTHIDLKSEIGKKCFENLEHSLPRDCIKGELTPFLMNMYAFENNFMGIDDYVNNTLRYPSLTGDDRSTQIANLNASLFVIALTGWAGFSVEEQYFSDLYGLDYTRKLKRQESPLSPLIAYENGNKSGFFKIRHYQFSEHILKIFSGSGTSISFIALTQRIIQFIKDTRGDESRLKKESLVRLLIRLFINRDWDISDDSTTKNIRNQQVYSAVISKLIAEHNRNQSSTNDKYNPETDSIIRIYQTLTKCYPDEVHFHAHLARYYFYTAGDYVNGIKSIDTAIEKAENSPSALALAYHIKGMGYRSEINNKILTEIHKIQREMELPNAKVEECVSELLELIKHMHSKCEQAYMCFSNSGKIGDNNMIYSLISECQLRIKIQREYIALQKLTAKYGISPLVDQNYYVQNQTILRNKNSDLQNCVEFFESDDETNNSRQDTTISKINDINLDAISLTNEDEYIINYCKQCLEDDFLTEKAHYRQIIAQKNFDEISNDLHTEENQRHLHNIIQLYEENIAEDPSNGAYIRSWFNAVRHLDCDNETALDLLESCQDKLAVWIEEGNASREAYLYRYIVRFLKDYEQGSLDSAESQRSLKQMASDVKSHSTMLIYKTNIVFWISNIGNGLRRLISNQDFRKMNSAEKLITLQSFEGRLPSRENFENNTAYITFAKHNVFFSPSSIKSRISKNNAGSYVEFGLGFSYDGLRSYHDSIKPITRKLISQAHSSGDSVYVRVIKHNTFWVECLIADEDQPVIISKFDLNPPYDPDKNIWPETGTELYVKLLEQKDYDFHGKQYEHLENIKKPYKALPIIKR